MKNLPAGLQAHLDGGSTTLCWCWRLTRRDGLRLGFTDHDRDLEFDGTTFEAAAGFTASEIKDSVGLNVDTLDVTSALSSSRLNEDDLAAGLFDDAAIEIFRVNWQSAGQRVLMRSGSIGEVRRTGTAFTAEVRGLAHYLQQPQGRLFQHGCDADLGDARCGVDLELPVFRAAAVVGVVECPRAFTTTGLAAFSGGWFTRGVVAWSSGANAGQRMEVQRHTAGGGAHRLVLWQPMPHLIEAGDGFVVTAGCDKAFSTCRTKFLNAASYRGFPHMPGNDFVASYPSRGDADNDGSSRTAGGAS